MNEQCPNCKVELERKYSFPGTVGTCPQCHTIYVKALDKLMTKEEYLERVKAEK